MQYTEIFSPVKIENFARKFFDIFKFFAQIIDCGYMLELPNEHPQSMFWSKNKKNRHTPAYLYYYMKVEYKGVFITRTCFPDEKASTNL